ncbi:MAG: FecR domain-containing protein [Myxococcales bacterium]|nr:FecR domain-containing protein [Myxococcales bacterium]
MRLYRPLIDWYLAGALWPALGERVRRHLMRCAECRSYYDEGVSLLRLTRGGPDAAGAGEMERLAARASFEGSLGRRYGVLGPRLGLWLIPAGAAAVGLLAILYFASPSEVGEVAQGGSLLVGGRPAVVHQVVREGELLEAVRGDSPVSLQSGHQVALYEGASLRFGAGGRRAELLRGRARFSVERERGGFEVHAGDAQVVVLGTVFTVERRAGGEEHVAVARGKVEVRGQGGRVLVFEGEETSVLRGLPAPPRASGRPEQPLHGDGELLEGVKRRGEKVLEDVGRALDRATKP